MAAIHGYLQIDDSVYDYGATLEPRGRGQRMACVAVWARRLPDGPSLRLADCLAGSGAVAGPGVPAQHEGSAIERQIALHHRSGWRRASPRRPLR